MLSDKWIVHLVNANNCVTRMWQEDSWLVYVGGTRLMKTEQATGYLKQEG